MNRENVLVVAVDGLRASALGAYGNTTFATPALDDFAAKSFLLDFCFAPATELGDIYRALWHSIHRMRPPVAEVSAPCLPQLFSNDGYTTTLITDDGDLRSFAASRHFDQYVEVPPADQPTDEDVAQTATARLFAATCEYIESQGHSAAKSFGTHRENSPQLIWMHSRGMYGPWDAPIHFQQSLLDEGDPPPLESVQPPDVVLSEDDDPDVAFRRSCAYAAQVMVVDTCWRGLMEFVEARSTEAPWLVVLLGVRGFPLGEHGRIGGVDPRLYGEQLHVPFLVRFPDGQGRLARSGALASHIDLLPTLAARIGPAELLAPPQIDGASILPLISNGNAEWRDALLSTSATSKSLRTASWCLRYDDAPARSNEQSDGGLQSDELYVRPDDQWEANNVAKLCADDVETLARVVDDVSQQLIRNMPLARKVLPENGGNG